MAHIGINHDQFISSAALVDNGDIRFAIPEERLNRTKQDRSFPQLAVQACLDQMGGELWDADLVVQSWNPVIHMEKFHPMASGRRRYRHEYLYSVPDHLLGFVGRPRSSHVVQEIAFDNGRRLRTAFVEHHMSHACSTYFQSPFDEAAILCCDGRGEATTTLWAHGKGTTIEPLALIDFPHSLGSYYSTFTEFLGFRPEGDEWKVMALAAYADYENEYTPRVRETVRLLEDGRFELDLTYYKEFVYELPHYYSDRFVEAFGPARDRDAELTERHYKIAAAMQCVFEEAVVNALNALERMTGSRDLCLAGGSFMNSVFNGKVLEKTNFERVYIPSCPDDSGVSVGAALYASYFIDGCSERYHNVSNYWGLEYGIDEIETVIDRFALGGLARKSDQVTQDTIDLIEKQKVVGWFQGRNEFGQRALGNRSILADPRDAAMKDTINAAIKYREPFRPFAPAILDEKAAEYFDMPGGAPVYFMEKVYRFLPEVRNRVGAVVHEDGSGRLQTVRRDINAGFYDLIEEFDRRTGVPILLNTSFNLNGEPIVQTPEDALRTFFASRMDAVVLGDIIVEKQ